MIEYLKAKTGIFCVPRRKIIKINKKADINAEKRLHGSVIGHGVHKVSSAKLGFFKVEAFGG